MKVMFGYTNIDGYHEDTYHFGIASIIASISGTFECVAEIVHARTDYLKFIEKLECFQPDVLAFTSVSSQFNHVRHLAKLAKEKIPSLMVVCGGTHATIYPDCVLDAEELDLVFVGEGEEVFREFLGTVDAGGDWRSCDSIAYVHEGAVVRNPVRPLAANLDHLPYPDKVTYPYIATVRATGYAPFFFSRGCPFQCTYCSNHAIARANGRERSITRYRSPESSIQEIKSTLAMFPEIKRISICDDIFGINKKWRREFLSIYSKEIRLPFNCLLRADVVNEEFISSLREAGCKRISFGVESGNEYIRNEVMGRSMSNETIINAFRLCREYGIETNAINIIGLPGETDQMLWDTIRLNRRIKPSDSGVNIFYPYKGTALGDRCFAEGKVDLNLFEGFSLERRGTVMAYPEAWRRKLEWYHRHWDRLVHPYDAKRAFRAFFKDTPVWTTLRAGKRVLRRLMSRA